MNRFQFFTLAVALWLSAGGFAEPQAGRIDVAHRVEDPAYGEVLYHYYQKQYFAAMTRIVLALERNEMPAQEARARVLLGALYASYGMPDEARSLFADLLDGAVAPELAARIWLHLAEIHYRSGEYRQALDLIDSELQDVPEDVADSYRALRTRLLMKLGRYDETAEMLSALEGRSILSGYLRYNLGVSRINAGQGEEGTSLLWQLVNLPPDDDETNALKDKAMLALGVHYLRSGEYPRAQALMKSARLDGPYSEMALLLHARAWLASETPVNALPSLQTLSGRSLQLEETQEALLALPFLYDRMGDYHRALAAYRESIRLYTGHFSYLNQVEKEIQDGRWFDQVAPDPVWSTAMDPVPPFEPVRVESFSTFRRVFASHEFQRYWRSWHEQLRQVNLLRQWLHRLPAMNQLLAAHVQRYRNALPQAAALLDQVEALKYGEALESLQGRFDKARQAQDMREFATGRERVWLDAMDEAGQRSARWQARLSPDVVDKVDFYRRVLDWELLSSEVPRYWQRQAELNELAQLHARNVELTARLEQAASGINADVYRKGEQLAGLNNALYQSIDEGEALLSRLRSELERQALAEVRLTRARLQYFIAECWAAMAELEHRALKQNRSRPGPADTDQSEPVRSEE